jgi:hypothetical protein
MEEEENDEQKEKRQDAIKHYFRVAQDEFGVNETELTEEAQKEFDRAFKRMGINDVETIDWLLHHHQNTTAARVSSLQREWDACARDRPDLTAPWQTTTVATTSSLSAPPPQTEERTFTRVYNYGVWDYHGVRVYDSPMISAGKTKLPTEKEAANDKVGVPACLACENYKACCVALDCGHNHLCSTCVRKLEKKTGDNYLECPSCRKPVKEFKVIFSL